MSTVHDRLRAIERLLGRLGGRLYDDTDIDGLDEVQAELTLRGETDRLAQLARLESEQHTLPSRRNSEQGRLF
jgi:hypothetical protein